MRGDKIMKNISTLRTAMTTTYSIPTRLIHWLTALLVPVTFALGPEDLDEMPHPELDTGLQLHETLGLVVILLTVLRLLWAVIDKRPEAVTAPRWMQMMSKAVQGALYLLLLAVPATAIVGTWLEGDALSLLGGLAVNSPLMTAKARGDSLLDLHPLLADALLWLAGLHAAAALFHHYVLKDSVLRSMLLSDSGKN